ncbi:MAG: hypothetical protein BGO41_13655 [Clostridiales bacterium 38-18]|nr:MAG: hypothetical protein BGO41_13655 [Clostridiales bacterium 38-18]
MHKRLQLENGLTIVFEKLEGYQSVSVGVWVKTGSSYETAKENGLSHFIEHMLFKGTSKRSARDIAHIIDGIGGELNAFTAKECTCYYTKTLSSDLPIAIDVLSDMICNSSFNEEHIETEKTVILDEINMYEDAAEEVVVDVLNEITFKGHPLSFPILGTKQTVSAFTREDLITYFNKFYRPDNMVISVTGFFDENELIKVIEDAFGGIARRQTSEFCKLETPKFNGGLIVKKKDFEQVQVAINFPGIEFDHILSYEMMILNNVLGGTNSSKLFQSIREDRGLTYSIYSEPNFYDELGTMTIGFGVSKENLSETMELIATEIVEIKKNLVSKEEFRHAQSHLRGSFFLNLEGSENLMDLIGRIELFAHKEKTIDDMLDKINHISMAGVNELISMCLSPTKVAMAVVGDVERIEIEKLYSNFVSRISK